MKEARPGRKYLGAPCKKCGKPILFRDVTERGVAFKERARFSLPCPECKHRDWYAVTDLHPYEVPSTDH